MKSKTLGILAAVMVLGVVVAIFLNQESASSLPKSGELLFPELLGVVNDVNEVVVETKEETITLVRGEQHWGIQEKEGYPADIEKVKQTLIGLAELRIHEPKTKNPELYERLGLLEKEQEGSTSTTVTLKTPTNPETAKVVIGNQRPSKGNPRTSDIYVRQPEDPQTWLVIGNLPLEKVSAQWLDTEITALTSKRVRRVKVTHPGGKSLLVSKKNPEDLDFQLDSVPAGFKVSSQFNLNNVVGTLVQLSLEDIAKEGDVDFKANSGASAVLETFDGLRLKVKTAKQDDKIFGKFSAEFDQDLVVQAKSPQAGEDKAESSSDQNLDEKKEDESAGKPTEVEKTERSEEEKLLKAPEEVQKEVDEFNQRVEGWVYELPKFRVENFTKEKKDLITKES